MQTNTFWLNFGGLSLAVPLKVDQGHQNLFSFLSCPNANLVTIRKLVHEILRTQAPVVSNLAV